MPAAPTGPRARKSSTNKGQEGLASARSVRLNKYLGPVTESPGGGPRLALGREMGPIQFSGSQPLVLPVIASAPAADTSKTPTQGCRAVSVSGCGRQCGCLATDLDKRGATWEETIPSNHDLASPLVRKPFARSLPSSPTYLARQRKPLPCAALITVFVPPRLSLMVLVHRSLTPARRFRIILDHLQLVRSILRRFRTALFVA
jgi:hypothetical protein